MCNERVACLCALRLVCAYIVIMFIACVLCVYVFKYVLEQAHLGMSLECDMHATQACIQVARE